MLECFDDLIDLHTFLYTRKYPVEKETILEEIQISERTFYRLLEVLRVKFSCVIESRNKKYKLVKRACFPKIYYGAQKC